MKKTLPLWFITAISIPGVAQTPDNRPDTAIPSKRLLDEVVISGYNTATRKQYTGAVTTVSGDKFRMAPTASFDQMLQGRAPGLYVASGSGQPGAPARMVIRGTGTNSDAWDYGASAPLYIVDGIAVESGVFMGMNPSDFESVSILKDANATALYGSRGANGVVLITTRRGQQGDVRISFNTRHGISQPSRRHFDMMNTQERLQFEKEVGQETGRVIGAGWIFSRTIPPTQASPPPQRPAMPQSWTASAASRPTGWITSCGTRRPSTNMSLPQAEAQIRCVSTLQPITSPNRVSHTAPASTDIPSVPTSTPSDESCASPSTPP